MHLTASELHHAGQTHTTCIPPDPCDNAPAQIPRSHACLYCSLQTGRVDGNTLVLDFPFPAFPDNMGHWAEILAPAYSCLASGQWRAHLPAGSHGHLDALLLVNLRREQLQAPPPPSAASKKPVAQLLQLIPTSRLMMMMNVSSPVPSPFGLIGLMLCSLRLKHPHMKRMSDD